MKYRKITVGILLGCLLLSGCDKNDDGNKQKGSNETQAIHEDDYSALLPFDVSSARYLHASQIGNLTDTLTISEGLMNLSKEHFSPQSYSYKESQFLDYDTLYGRLLGRESEKNPKGLNPSVDSEFVTKNKEKIKAPVLVYDIFEIDWYQKEELSGLSLAMVVSSQYTKDNVTHTIDKEAMDTYIKVYAPRVIEYLRTTYPQVKNLPIYMTIYDIAGDQEGVPGSFKKEAYFEGNSANFSNLDETWTIFPTERSKSLDDSTNTIFLNYKKKLEELDLGEDNSIIGTGKFQDGKLTLLKIKVNAHAKTGLEMNAMVQTLNENLSLFTSTDIRITVDVSCENTHYAVIERAKGSSKTTTIYI